MSNLQIVARRCPVMSKALAVQSVRSSTLNSAFGRRASGGLSLQKRNYVVPSKPVTFNSTGNKHAQAADIEDIHIKVGVYNAADPTKPGMYHAHLGHQLSYGLLTIA
jgi:5-aminolevulinate synthase